MKISIKAFALTCGLFWAASMFSLTWWMLLTNNAGGITLIHRVYLGYTVSPGGSVIGLLWGFADGLIAGSIFAWLYNLINSSVQANAG